MNTTKLTSFSAIVKLPPTTYSGDEVTVDVELDKDEEHLTYDEVEEAVVDRVRELYGIKVDGSSMLPDEDLLEVISIVINADDGESYPVVSESMNDSQLKSSTVFSKYLVLPDAVYELTPEAKLWMNLKKNGIIGEDVEFDFETYHKIFES